MYLDTGYADYYNEFGHCAGRTRSKDKCCSYGLKGVERVA